MAEVRQKWTLTQEAFDKLLLALGGDGDGPDRGGQKYLEIRGNLIRFFEWRGCPFPEDHADETINRMARRVAEGEELLFHHVSHAGPCALLIADCRS